MQFRWNYFCFQLLKAEKLKKDENSCQKVINPLSQGHVPFKLSVQIVKGDMFEGHLGRAFFKDFKYWDKFFKKGHFTRNVFPRGHFYA